MDANLIIAPGFPYELLGLLRRMPGIDDLNLLQDSERFMNNFTACYPDKNEYSNLLKKACELGVIAEMASILEEPMWRKRSFINKSIIQMTAEDVMKEYQSCEILESFMQIFGWDFEVKVARRWNPKEEDTSEYYQNNIKPSAKEKSEFRHKEERVKKEVVTEKEEEFTQESDPGDNSDSIKNASRINEVRKHSFSRKNTCSEPKDELRSRADIKELTPQKKQKLKRVQRKVIQEDTTVYADEDNIYDMDAYIKNEILKGGVRFENLMSNTIKRDFRSAVKGNSEAQYRMGKYYAESNTKHTDYEEALKWYRVSASQGNKKAQFELGMLYDGGKVKCKDYKQQAMKCYIGLAESGFPTAQCMVGMKYKFGDGVEEDIKEAIKWFKKAAAQGHTDAQRNLGDTYMAIGKNNEAIKWYERAASAGDAYCEKLLGSCK